MRRRRGLESRFYLENYGPTHVRKISERDSDTSREKPPNKATVENPNKNALLQRVESGTGHDRREMPPLIDGEVKVAQEGIRLPQSLELDVVVRPARGGRERCATAAAAVATKFFGVEAAFRCEGFDERE